MNNNPSSAILEALSVVCELTDTTLSPVAVRVMAQDLALYPVQQVLVALTRCRRELRSRLTLADILARLDDGRPGPEEAWAICAPTLNDERPTVVRTAEMDIAFGVAANHNGAVAARMAFIESYKALCATARANHVPASWQPSLGTDAAGKDGALLAAVRDGKLTTEHAQSLLSYLAPIDPQTQRLLGMIDQKRIGQYNAKTPQP